jgi:uncharacterized protein (TIGR02246 family)
MRSLIAAAAIVAATCTGIAAQAADPAIAKVAQRYQEAFNRGDAKGVAALHAPDVLRVLPDGRLLTGRAAVEQELAALFAGSLKGARLTLRPGATRPLSADAALIEGTYEIVGSTSTLRGRYLNTVERKGGEWLLASVTSIHDTAAGK